MTTDDKTYTCSSCKGVFHFEWSDEEARAEQEENGWGDIPDEHMAIVCDDCYNKIMREVQDDG